MEKKNLPHAFRDKTGEYWRYHFQFQRKRYTNKGRKYPTQESASLAAQEHKARLKAEFQAQGWIGTTFVGISEKFLDSLVSDEHPIGNDVIQNKAKAAADFLAFMGDLELEINSITEYDIEEFLKTRPSKDSYNRYRTHLSQIFEYAIIDMKITFYNPVKKVRRKKRIQRKKRYCPTHQEILQLIGVAGDDFPTSHNARHKHVRCDERDLLLCIIHTMGRYGEVLQLRWEEVRWAERILVKKTHKTEGQIEKEIPVPINSDLYAILQRRWQERLQDKWVFWNHRTLKPYDRRPKLMKRLCKKAGIDKDITFHGLRHFIATKLANDATIPITTVKDLLGHEDLKTTQGYLHPVNIAQRYASKTLEGRFNPALLMRKTHQLSTTPKTTESANCNTSTGTGSDPDIIDGDYKVIE